MRISDWSSVVCSSDLLRYPHWSSRSPCRSVASSPTPCSSGCTSGGRPPESYWISQRPSASHWTTRCVSSPGTYWTSESDSPNDNPHSPSRPWGLLFDQNGRASCGERVCQDGKILGGAV